jgi:hypothetical protein
MALEYATSLNNLRLEQYFDISSSDMLITAALVGDSRRPGGG